MPPAAAAQVAAALARTLHAATVVAVRESAPQESTPWRVLAEGGGAGGAGGGGDDDASTASTAPTAIGSDDLPVDPNKGTLADPYYVRVPAPLATCEQQPSLGCSRSLRASPLSSARPKHAF